MRIDHSGAKAFRTCPRYYYERYVQELESIYPNAPFEFGSRMHNLLAGYYAAIAGKPPIPDEPIKDEALEAEAQVMFAGYQLFYPEDPFEIVAVEQTLDVPLPDSDHSYAFKADLIVRDKATGLLRVVDHKTEKRGGKGNGPEARASNPQFSLYQWAASRYYNEPFGPILLNVLTRQSPKGQEAATFWRDNLERTLAQQEEEVRSLVYTAGQIEAAKAADYWMANRDECFTYQKCTYYALHTGTGLDPGLVHIHFKKAEPYLDVP